MRLRRLAPPSNARHAWSRPRGAGQADQSVRILPSAPSRSRLVGTSGHRGRDARELGSKPTAAHTDDLREHKMEALQREPQACPAAPLHNAAFGPLRPTAAGTTQFRRRLRTQLQRRLRGPDGCCHLWSSLPSKGHRRMVGAAPVFSAMILQICGHGGLGDAGRTPRHWKAKPLLPRPGSRDRSCEGRRRYHILPAMLGFGNQP
jgi:hypothetical protein